MDSLNDKIVACMSKCGAVYESALGLPRTLPMAAVITTPVLPAQCNRTSGRNCGRSTDFRKVPQPLLAEKRPNCGKGRDFIGGTRSDCEIRSTGWNHRERNN
ncbi:hypothetical protein YQE_04642, partial [Dendroctonus ponderosae]